MTFLKLITTVGSFIPLLAFAQEGVKDLDPVWVNGSEIRNQTSITYLPKQRIERRLATDAGQLLTLFPGMQLKSYGGLGGMKTVSFRSLGAGHTSVVIDHFALSQTQSGQTDLGQIPVDFIQTLAVVNQAGTSLDYPIHAKVAGQIIAIQTRQLPFPGDTFQLTVGSQVGSFGQADGHFLIGQRINRWRYSVSAKARRFDGDYPFSYRNGSTTVETKRTNGDLKDAFGTATISFQATKNHGFHLSYSTAQFNKGLPGAVVFYNETAGQRLYGQNHNLNLRHLYKSNQWGVATTAAFQQNSLDYVDSNYLNTQGYLHSHYLSQQSELHSQARFTSKNQLLDVLLGAGTRFEQLFSQSFSLVPKRFTGDGILSATYRRFGVLSAQTGIQAVNDIRPKTTRHTFAILPSVDWSYLTKSNFGIAIGYRYTVRQPSFNELYYNQIGNDGLRPEKAHLAWIRVEKSSNPKQFRFKSSLQPFYVYARDKILSIPTKNLFVWSIQNIGKSQAIGIEATQGIAYRFPKATLALNVNYTFQYTQDLSNPGGATYGQILSYCPLHAGTAELSFEQKAWGLSTLLTYQGKRYALNENIPANLLSDFWLLDCSAFYRFNLKKHKLTVRGALNNITNNYYSYIRYFVMPGRNFTLRVVYEF